MSRVCCYAALLLLGIGVASAVGIKNVGWWKNTPFYQIYPRSFMDSNGDGIGDLNGITSKLNHFVEAGIGAIWLSPIFASPMKDFGYDISNFTAIQPEYGTMADFEALTKAAHGLGLKVILDLVPNHVSDKHEWFDNSVKKVEGYEDFFMWQKPGTNVSIPPNNWISVFGNSAWTFHEVRQEWYFHQFLAAQPDLNYRNTLVQQEMIKVIQFWLDKGVDGFRVDAVPHLYEISSLKDEPRSSDNTSTSNQYTYLDHIYTKDQPETYDLVKSWRKVLDDYAERNGTNELVMMTEAYTSLNKTVEFYDAGAHVPFNFKFIIDVNDDSPPSAFKTIIDTWMNETNKRNATANWVMGNHDRVRLESRYPGRGDQMVMLEMILPGVSVTYYGEEIGMVNKEDITYEETQDPQGCQAGRDHYKEQSRDPCRTPFQWSNSTSAGFSKNSTTWMPVNENYKTLNLENEKVTASSHFNLFRSLTSLKKSSPALSRGSLHTFVLKDKVLGVLRTHIMDDAVVEMVVLLMNFDRSGNVTIDVSSEIPTIGNFKTMLEMASVGSPLQRGDTFDLTQLTLGPKAAVVITARNGAGNNPVSFIKATVILVSSLFITLR